MILERRTLKFGRIFLVLALCAALLGSLPVEALGLETDNGILWLSVQDDPAEVGYGAFVLGAAGQDSLLTYARFYSSCTTVMVNGTAYRFDEGQVVTPVRETEDGSIVLVQRFGAVEVTQTLTLTTGNSQREDMLRIHYAAVNLSGEDVLFSVRILLDPALAGVESHEVAVGEMLCHRETAFSGDQIPDNWSIRDSDGQILAYGIVDGGNGKPDMLLAANWGRLFDHKSDCTTEGSAVITDNAVALVWQDRTVKTGGTVELSTKYGLYSTDPVATTQPTEQTTVPTSQPVVTPPTGDAFLLPGVVLMLALSCAAMVTLAVFAKRRDNR